MFIPTSSPKNSTGDSQTHFFDRAWLFNYVNIVRVYIYIYMYKMYIDGHSVSLYIIYHVINIYLLDSSSSNCQSWYVDHLTANRFIMIGGCTMNLWYIIYIIDRYIHPHWMRLNAIKSHWIPLTLCPPWLPAWPILACWKLSMRHSWRSTTQNLIIPSLKVTVTMCAKVKTCYLVDGC